MNINCNTLNKKQQQELLDIARTSVENYIRSGSMPEFNISDDRLKQKQGAFVTLRKNGKLRGCIGQIIPSEKPLWQVVQNMAIAAANKDNRFSSVKAEELEKINYEISALSISRKINNWQEVELGKHGVIISKGLRCGVFLPQVADETGWSKEEFLSQLCCQKAGLSTNCYKNDKDVELKIFTVQIFSEE